MAVGEVSAVRSNSAITRSMLKSTLQMPEMAALPNIIPQSWQPMTSLRASKDTRYLYAVSCKYISFAFLADVPWVF